MNKIKIETGLSDHHKIRVKVSWTHSTWNRFIWSSWNKSKSFMNTVVLETSISDYHKIRVKVSWTH